MKKVLLSKSLQICVTAPETKIIQQINVKTPPIISTSPVINNSKFKTITYMQRKSCQPIYEDIFKLLMRIPDKALQQRVIDAINGRTDKSTISSPNQCKQCAIKSETPKKVSVSTQTDIPETKPLKIETAVETILKEENTKPELSALEDNALPATSVTKEVSEAGTSQKVARKRGRRRNMCVPQAVKLSSAQQALQDREDKQLTPLNTTKKRKVSEERKTNPEKLSNTLDSSLNEINSDSPGNRRFSIDSNLSAYLNSGDMQMDSEWDSYCNGDSQSIIINKMRNEFLIAGNMSPDGLLPIHEAILDNNSYGVQRQLFVWTKLRTDADINDLLTQDGEDCIQLALDNDCKPEIVNHILKAGILTNHIYSNANTAVHMAIINNVESESLRHLMMHIDLDMLLKPNYDGYTPLHIAVRYNRYKLAEVILNTIDERQLGAIIYNSTSNDETETLKDEKKFAKFYERACDRLDSNKDKLMRVRLKHEIINASEARAGNTCLFYAVEAEMEHFCYFLLAHLSDPDIENLSGHSPKSYHYEFARLLRINLKIARIMDRVLNILNGKSS